MRIHVGETKNAKDQKNPKDDKKKLAITKQGVPLFSSMTEQS
jgi:hypothetical protein